MTFKDWDELLKFLVVLTKWPPIVLLIALVFRNAIAKKISGLEKIKVKETEIVFRALKELRKVAQESKPELVRQILLNVPLVSLAEGGEANKPEAGGQAEEKSKASQEDEDDALEAEKVDLEQLLASLENEDLEGTA